ncbi:MAG: hypothetical protein A2651_01880 [Candidatus Yanofskybacteria bacterium RIFCSPHIGHO2_01_FULL_42_12]|uniref:Heat-inducible transcription repressor HrcA n=1 Tax=Candidatus Yanofskybacteria bacterium RIFCSPLOWO2_01_FULL_42_49 TaxID=1802694 RepID=A0A1F8GAS7_9BACT|nr:MAG: hypothetical protein A2651_01880 [Candidatus Yanofskybacteria bacterium RIFCSPHIGHO2_01_FULL_42_12]OGN22484.1 MAG: hypothetical protein A2918_01840 [Candidatus Yanofskybacteria bacterium RIFCSPLOWO2_01_FULL_42_49]
MITGRQGKLLNFIIKEYVKTAKPVGSAFIAKKGGFDLSPASLRGEMCALEQAGYLSHLHTSGGRVPTDKAYRHFVNNLLENDSEPTINEKRKIKTAVNSSSDPYRLNQGIARILSELSENLVITKVLDDDNFYKVGLASLFEMPEFREFDRIFRLTSFFDEFDQMFEKIETGFFKDFKEESAPGFNVFIGRENSLPGIRDETIMTARYDLPEGLEGLLTLVGPTRMDYERNISLVKYTTEQLNQMARQI